VGDVLASRQSPVTGTLISFEPYSLLPKTKTTNDVPLTSNIMSFDPKKRSPTLQKLLKTRLAPIRENELITKALNPERPIKPPADGRECCGSACKPCVMDLYGEELRVWKECWRDRIPGIEDGNKKIDIKTEKMPGSFDW
jgi:Oxidoreductase-like protein, N-terminal